MTMKEEVDSTGTSHISYTCQVAEEFIKLYYDWLDNKRNLLILSYMDSAVLTWDGNGVCGKDAIKKFFDAFPITAHTVTSIDAQHVINDAVKNDHTVAVVVGGYVKLGTDKLAYPFVQHFVITAQENKWKIVSDCCRLQLVSHDTKN